MQNDDTEKKAPGRPAIKNPVDYKLRIGGHHAEILDGIRDELPKNTRGNRASMADAVRWLVDEHDRREWARLEAAALETVRRFHAGFHKLETPEAIVDAMAALIEELERCLPDWRPEGSAPVPYPRTFG